MISIHTFELTLETTTKEFNELLSCAYNMAKANNNRLGYSTRHMDKDVRVDDCLSDYGIMIEYHNYEFRKSIRFRVNPSEILGGSDLKLWEPTDKNIKRLITLLNDYIYHYFHSRYKLNDLILTRIEFTANINVGKENVPAYIRLMHRIGKVKKYSPKYNKQDYIAQGIVKEHSFDLEGNSNNIGFTVYDKEADLKKKGKDRKAQKAQGILRIEVRLKKRKAVEQALHIIADENNISTKKQIKYLCQNSTEIFMNTFVSIVPFGNSYHLKEAEKIVNTSDFKAHQKEKMLSLLKLIPEKKSLYFALKELNVRHPDDVLLWFAQLNLSPITICKREKIDYLENLYEYFQL